jgi:predicted small metal-binding protein
MDWKSYLTMLIETYYYRLYKKYNLIKLRCNDYGFECDFVVEGEITHVIEKFGKHTDEEHGIDYSKDALMQIILRKK